MTALQINLMQSSRLVAACGIVALVVFGPIAFDNLSGAAAGGDAQPEPISKVLRESGATSPFTTLDRVEALADSALAWPSMQFCDEVGLPAEARDVRVSAGGSVVGFVVDGDVADVLEAVDSTLQSKGWTAVELGAVDGSTYVKTGGSYSWALVTGTQVGESVSVVVRCMRR